MPHSPVQAEQALDYGLFSRRQARRAGYTTAGISLRVRRGEWAPAGRGLLRATGRVEQSGDELLLTVLRAGPSAVASHLSAARVLGWDLLEPPAEAQLTIPRNASRVKLTGARIFRRELATDEVTAVGVLPVTCPARTAIDIAADCPSPAAVVAIDAALRAKQVTLGELQSELLRRPTMPQRPKVTAVLDLVDPTSGSVPESLARLLFQSSGLPLPECQFIVRDDGTFVARVDFAWPAARLIVEVDGFAWHSSRDAQRNDVTRQRRLTLAGWAVLRFTADEVRSGPEQVVADVRQALGR
jgi:hypothetical protein